MRALVDLTEECEEYVLRAYVNVVCFLGYVLRMLHITYLTRRYDSLHKTYDSCILKSSTFRDFLTRQLLVFFPQNKAAALLLSRGINDGLA